MFFRKYQEKEKTSKKAGEHQKREELSSSTGKTGRASGKSGEAKEKSGVSFTTPGKEEELQKKLVNTGRRRSSDTTPRKGGALPGKLVKSEKTPEKDGETPGKRGEPKMISEREASLSIASSDGTEPEKWKTVLIFST